MNCPVCHRPMTRFATGWKCMNVSAPEHDRAGKSKPGRPGSGAPRKKKGSGK